MLDVSNNQGRLASTGEHVADVAAAAGVRGRGGGGLATPDTAPLLFALISYKYN